VWNVDIEGLVEDLVAQGTGARARQVQVVVELAWDLPTDQVVTMDMWMSSASIESNKFLKEIRDPIGIQPISLIN